MSERVQLLRAKLHKARVTDASLEYEGSLGIDLDIMDDVGLLPYEKILVVNITNGERLETYAIPSERGSKAICLNGAAARKGCVNDRVIIMSFGLYDRSEAASHKPVIHVMNEHNEVLERK